MASVESTFLVVTGSYNDFVLMIPRVADDESLYFGVVTDDFENPDVVYCDCSGDDDYSCGKNALTLFHHVIVFAY